MVVTELILQFCALSAENRGVLTGYAVGILKMNVMSSPIIVHLFGATVVPSVSTGR